MSLHEIQLSENFRLYETRCRGVEEKRKCCCHGAVQWPPSELIRILQRYRDHMGPIHVTSWFRCDAYNKAVGGHSRSYHRLGHAADITFPLIQMGPDWEEVTGILNQLVDDVVGSRVGNIFYYPTRKFIHVDVGRMTVKHPRSTKRVRRL